MVRWAVVVKVSRADAQHVSRVHYALGTFDGANADPGSSHHPDKNCSGLLVGICGFLQKQSLLISFSHFVSSFLLLLLLLSSFLTLTISITIPWVDRISFVGGR